MIKRLSIAGVFLALGLTCGQAQTNDAYVLAGLTGYDGTKTFDVASTDAFATLVHEAKLDNEALPRAYANLVNAWRTAHAKNDKNVRGGGKSESRPEPFPLKNPPPREVRQLGVFGTADEANKQKQALESQEAARLKRLEAEEQHQKPPEPAETGLKHPPRRAPTNQAKGPDPALVKDTWAALISEIATVRADIAAGDKAGSKPDAPKPPRKSHRK